MGKISFLPAAARQSDLVLAIDPPAGTGVPPGSRIHLLVSSEAFGQSYLMPDLYGLNPEQAREELKRYGLS